MSIDREYAIQKDIRNNPVVREADRRQKREFFRILLLVVLTVGTLLFSAKWQTDMRLAGMRLELQQAALETERAQNRVLRLSLETARTPKTIEQAARRLGLRAPTLSETVVIERAPESSPAGAVVARAR